MRSNCGFRIWLLLALALCPSAAFGQPALVFDTPEKLWRDFNPESPDLDIDSLKKWNEGGIAYEKLRFTSEREAGGKVRVFAIRGAPLEGSRLPGILHIHGGGQTASLDWVRYWAKRGYVCVTFDYTGPWAGRKEFTDWGPIKQGNLTDAQGGMMFRPTARASSFFHWALAARRALTLLSYHPKVDRDRLGIFGVSVGGTLSWLVAGTDQRVKTSVPIYGCGYNYDRKKTAWGFPEPNPALALFNRVLAPRLMPPPSAGPSCFWGRPTTFMAGWTTPIRSSRRQTSRSGWLSRRATTTTSTRPRLRICRRGWTGNSAAVPPSRPRQARVNRPGGRRPDGERPRGRRSARRTGGHFLHAGRQTSSEPVLAAHERLKRPPAGRPRSHFYLQATSAALLQTCDIKAACA